MSQNGLVLASTSPRRRQLMALGGWVFETRPADIDETPLSGEEPRAYVLRMAVSKARAAAAQQINSGEVIIAADTTVVYNPPGGQPVILGKPEDEADADRMLKLLRSKTHQVYTAIAVLRTSDEYIETDLATTDVHMRDYSDEEIAAYVATGDPMDKAGAYAIQHPEFNPVDALQGCYSNVVGLPVCHLACLLDKFGYPARVDISRGCEKELFYQCPVCQQTMQRVN